MLKVFKGEAQEKFSFESQNQQKDKILSDLRQKIEKLEKKQNLQHLKDLQDHNKKLLK